MTGVQLLVAIGLCCVMAAADPVCQEVSVNNQAMVQAQVLPSEFIVDIEVVKREDPSVQNIRMYYSKSMKYIRLDILDAQVKSSMYFYFQYDDILKFDFKEEDGRGKCSVISDLSNSVDNFLFGGIDPSSKSQSIPVPLAALHFMGVSGFSHDKIKESYIGRGSTRDKTSTKYTSCQWWKSAKNDIVLNVTHSFALEAYAFPYADNKDSTLLSMDIKGTGTVNGIHKERIDHTYNFVNFRGFPDGDTSFETPEGIVCPGRSHTKEFPTPAPYIKYTGEIVHHTHHRLSYQTVVYDFLQKFAIIKKQKKLNSHADMNRETMVLDFSMGKVLILDDVEPACVISDLSTFKTDVDLFRMKGKKAVIDDPNQFFLADPSNFTYLGQKKIRGMNTEVWVAPTKSLPDYPDAVVQFHFAPLVSSWNDRNEAYLANNWSTPVKVKVWKNNADKHFVTENLFHVDFNMIRPGYYDLTLCYKFQTSMQIVVKATRSVIDTSYQEAFKYKTVSAISQLASLGPAQITQMKLFYSTDEMFVEFIIGGEDKVQISEAVSAVEEALKTGKFVFKARNSASGKWDVKLPFVEVNSVILNDKSVSKSKSKSKSDSKSGYTGGAMAGLGVGMVIVGMLGGAGVGFAHGKYFG